MPRPKKPADLKEASGSRHGVKLEAATLEDLKEPEKIPDWLSDSGKKQWERIAPMLASQGKAKEIDRPAICSLCHALGIFHSTVDPQECRLLLKAISELLEKFNMTPKARQQSGFGISSKGIDTRIA